ncbi:hypothetical protein PsorP6_002917 [Peronosclerospora sorghi]|uniref:Uncharacterized protein n=1 Tax=Peronosclerospora sorghi TaxID=230839 RepID=A0ACC0VIL2_9STRA|nr:hypothetical protein PsorP6_002917 [Peronosclerospora sorghi]
MLSSFFKNKFEGLNLVVPCLVAAVVATTVYYTSTFVVSSTHPAKAKQDDTIVQKRVRYLPSKIPLLGNAIELLLHSDRLYDWIAEHHVLCHGQPFILRLPGKDDMMFIAKPEHIEQVLKTQFENFPKSRNIHDVFFDLLGDGIVVTNNETWKRQRRVLVNLFSARALRERMTPIVHKHLVPLRRIVENAASCEKSIDVFKLMHRYTLDVIAEIGFGTELKVLEGENEAFAEALERAQYIASARFKQPNVWWKMKRWLNIRSEKKMRHAINVIDEHVMKIISSAMERHQERKESTAAVRSMDKDIISIILDSMEHKNEVVDLVEIRDIATAALIAGRDTTADALAWFFYVLSQHPSVEAKLRTELIAHLPKLSWDPEYMPSADDLNKIHYLEATIRELLRLVPPGPLLAATHCIRDTVFPDGTFVPKNTDIIISVYSTGRLGNLWGEDALEFNPERFLDAETGEVLKLPSSKFCAFSAGPRICVGQSLAYLEMKTIIAQVISRYHLVLEPGQKPAYSQGITLGMQKPLIMRVESIDALDSCVETCSEKSTSSDE